MPLYDAEAICRQTEVTNGQKVEFPPDSYRHQLIYLIHQQGRHSAEFANGTFNYFAYWRLVRANGSWNRAGANIIPILPDGRILMVIEDRPALLEFGQAIKYYAVIGGELTSLRDLHPDALAPSLEFPSGEIKHQESVTIAALRELAEETGIKSQQCHLYQGQQLYMPFGCDLAHGDYMAVACLTDSAFADYVQNDGNLRVVALTPSDIETNIDQSKIPMLQSGIFLWLWYKRFVSPCLEKNAEPPFRTPAIYARTTQLTAA